MLPAPKDRLSSPAPVQADGPLPLLQEKIQAYHGSMSGEHHRYRSWEHCFTHFQTAQPKGIQADPKAAALNRAFYLASWGMYRGSSFLLQHAYTVHLGVVDVLASSRLSILWKQEFGAGPNDSQLLPIILSAADLVRSAYQSFAASNESRDASDTLITKVLLGTVGCLPACDRYFIDGFKAAGQSYSSLNVRFVTRLSQIAARNLPGLRKAQDQIVSSTGVRYPLMKLLDMYFWQLGYECGNSEPHA
jgi:hypothetical protein